VWAHFSLFSVSLLSKGSYKLDETRSKEKLKLHSTPFGKKPAMNPIDALWLLLASSKVELLTSSAIDLLKRELIRAKATII
jgi:hypothetical protein